MSAKKKQVVLFYMDGCPYCELMRPAWKKFKAAHSKDVPIVEIERARMPPGLPVFSFPTIALLEDGQIKKVYKGPRTPKGFAGFASGKGGGRTRASTRRRRGGRSRRSN